MDNSEVSRPTAPEVFDELVTPKDLADYFRQYADEMVENGLALRDDENVISPLGRGVNIIFDSDGEHVECVILQSPTPAGHRLYQISFDEGGVYFYLNYFDKQGIEVPQNKEFNRQILGPEDDEVNRFFADMAEDIERA